MPGYLEERPYKVYRAGPRSLRARLRGEEDVLLPGREPDGRKPLLTPERTRWAIARRAALTLDEHARDAGGIL